MTRTDSMTIAKAADEIGVSYPTAHRWTVKGYLKPDGEEPYGLHNQLRRQLVTAESVSQMIGVVAARRAEGKNRIPSNLALPG